VILICGSEVTVLKSIPVLKKRRRQGAIYPTPPSLYYENLFFKSASWSNKGNVHIAKHNRKPNAPPDALCHADFQA